MIEQYGEKMTENEYVIVRTYSAGVFAGELKERQGKEVSLTNARRLWFWAGAASLSELAQRGTSRPDKCKFPVDSLSTGSGYSSGSGSGDGSGDGSGSGYGYGSGDGSGSGSGSGDGSGSGYGSGS